MAPPRAPRRRFALVATFLMLAGTLSGFGTVGAREDALVVDGGESPSAGNILSGGYATFDEIRTLQVTNVTEQGGRSPGATFELVPQDAATPTDARTATPSGAGKLEVTFPDVHFGSAGGWRILGPDDFEIRMVVEPRESLVVTLSNSHFAPSSSDVAFTITVTYLSTDEPAPGAHITGPEIPANARTDDAGRYVYFGPLPPPGTYAITAGLDLEGNTAPELVGETSMTVQAPDVALTVMEGSAQLSVLQVRPATGTSTSEIAAGSYSLRLSITSASGDHPTTEEGFSTSDIAISGALLPGWAIENYDPSTGTADLSGVVPTHAGGEVAFTVEWRGTTRLVLPITHGARLTSSHATITAQTATSVTFHLEDSNGNAIPDGKIYVFSGQRGAHPGIATTPMNGTGASRAGRNGDYTLTLDPEVSGILTAYGETGPQERTPVYIPIVVNKPTTIIEIGNVTVGLVTPREVPVIIRNTEDLGTATIELRYDPTVLNVDNITARTASACELMNHHEPATGLLRMLVTCPTIPGHHGALEVARLTFSSAGSPGASTDLDLASVELTDSSGAPMPAIISDGHARVGILGDVNGDDLLSQLDVTTASEYVVGARGVGDIVLALADVNKDGRVSGVDVMFISQVLAGTRAGF